MADQQRRSFHSPIPGGTKFSVGYLPDSKNSSPFTELSPDGTYGSKPNYRLEQPRDTNFTPQPGDGTSAHPSGNVAYLLNPNRDNPGCPGPFDYNEVKDRGNP
jgi:hypothetical protein